MQVLVSIRRKLGKVDTANVGTVRPQGHVLQERAREVVAHLSDLKLKYGGERNAIGRRRVRTFLQQISMAAVASGGQKRAVSEALAGPASKESSTVGAGVRR